MPKSFRKISSVLGEPNVDLLASRLCLQLPEHMAWRLNPNSIATNAIQQDWNKSLSYAFPPFCMINQILHKVIREEIDQLIIVTPSWQTQPWYAQLLHLFMDNSLLLAQDNNLLQNPLGQKHSLIMGKSLKLAARKI